MCQAISTYVDKNNMEHAYFPSHRLISILQSGSLDNLFPKSQHRAACGLIGSGTSKDVQQTLPVDACHVNTIGRGPSLLLLPT